MNEVSANEDALTITRGADVPCSIRWDELRSVGSYQIEDTTYIDFHCTTGGFLTADSDMRGFARLMKTLDVYVPITLHDWRDRIASIDAGTLIELYTRPEPSEPPEDTDLRHRLANPEFPRASQYDPQWLIDNAMGPHPLWLTEWLTQSLDLRAGMRILDLGCGRAVSSIFLAREFNVTVWAVDRYVKPSDNAGRVQESAVGTQVFPIDAEARMLPFAHDYFDAIVSIDAYHDFGTDDLYLAYITQFLRPGGKLGIVVPSVKTEITGDLPAHLKPYWEPGFCTFHSTAWWQRHWQKTGLVTIETADTLDNGPELWQQWSDACAAHTPSPQKDALAKEAERLQVDSGKTFAFTRLIARKL